jgi:hypothetical protein
MNIVPWESLKLFGERNHLLFNPPCLTIQRVNIQIYSFTIINK